MEFFLKGSGNPALCLGHGFVLQETTGGERKGSSPGLLFAEDIQKGKCQVASRTNSHPSSAEDMLLKEPESCHNLRLKEQ